jgi:hypothetical protein
MQSNNALGNSRIRKIINSKLFPLLAPLPLN